jgi:uncharacterized protein
MYTRDIAEHVRKAFRGYSAVVLLGPRQSGKTTLARQLFPDFDYLSLEDPDVRLRASEDPRSFLERSAPRSLVLDEVQRAPQLLSYLQTLLDAPSNQRRFVLTGSHNLLLAEKVAQTLAGRTRMFTLLPLSQHELSVNGVREDQSLDERMFFGGYPRIYDKGLDPTEWLGQYHATYVERDVRVVSNVVDLDTFDRFVRLLAGRVGQVLNLSSLGGDCGISQPTAAAWLSVLKTSYVAMTLTPFFRNFGKRLIKSPKPYFFDTGFLCYLLRITNPDQLAIHPLRGAIFENWVVVETLKSFTHTGLEAPLYFWRDTRGHEVDLVIDRGTYLDAIEIKSSATFHPSFSDGLAYFAGLQDRPGGTVYYGGTSSFTHDGYDVRGWKAQPGG